jgi:hypothetical protein
MWAVNVFPHSVAAMFSLSDAKDTGCLTVAHE